MPTFIELGDGSSFQMAEGQWQVAALASCAPLDGNSSTLARLIVSTSDREGVLVYVEIESLGGILRMGELLPLEAPGILRTMQNLVTLYGLPPSCFESCLEQLYRK